jgi:hypothetical protein
MGWVEDGLKEAEELIAGDLAKMSRAFPNSSYHDMVSKCQIMRVGAELVALYDEDNAAEIVAEYITPYGDGPIPTFHEFMLWYCNSQTIKEEVDSER